MAIASVETSGQSEPKTELPRTRVLTDIVEVERALEAVASDTAILPSAEAVEPIVDAVIIQTSQITVQQRQDREQRERPQVIPPAGELRDEAPTDHLVPATQKEKHVIPASASPKPRVESLADGMDQAAAPADEPLATGEAVVSDSEPDLSGDTDVVTGGISLLEIGEAEPMLDGQVFDWPIFEADEWLGPDDMQLEETAAGIGEATEANGLETIAEAPITLFEFIGELQLFAMPEAEDTEIGAETGTDVTWTLTEVDSDGTSMERLPVYPINVEVAAALRTLEPEEAAVAEVMVADVMQAAQLFEKVLPHDALEMTSEELQQAIEGQAELKVLVVEMFEYLGITEYNDEMVEQFIRTMIMINKKRELKRETAHELAPEEGTHEQKWGDFYALSRLPRHLAENHPAHHLLGSIAVLRFTAELPIAV